MRAKDARTDSDSGTKHLIQEKTQDQGGDSPLSAGPQFSSRSYGSYGVATQTLTKKEKCLGAGNGEMRPPPVGPFLGGGAAWGGFPRWRGRGGPWGFRCLSLLASSALVSCRLVWRPWWAPLWRPSSAVAAVSSLAVAPVPTPRCCRPRWLCALLWCPCLPPLLLVALVPPAVSRLWPSSSPRRPLGRLCLGLPVARCPCRFVLVWRVARWPSSRPLRLLLVVACWWPSCAPRPLVPCLLARPLLLLACPCWPFPRRVPPCFPASLAGGACVRVARLAPVSLGVGFPPRRPCGSRRGPKISTRGDLRRPLAVVACGRSARRTNKAGLA